MAVQQADEWDQDGFASAPDGGTDGQQALLGIGTPPVSPDPLEGPRWASNTVTYSLATANLSGQPGGVTFSSFITDAATTTLVRKAAALWSAISGLTLTMVADSASAAIRIGYQRLNPGSTGTIGLTNYSSINSLFRPGVTVGLEDPAELAVSTLPDADFGYSGYSTHLFQVLMHEIGHALGLGHNGADPASVMYAVGTASNRSIDTNDAAAIEQLYGGSPVALATETLSNPGPTRLSTTPGGTVNPFANLVVAGGTGLYQVVRIVVTGGGTLSDPTPGSNASFAGSVFTESGVNLTTFDYAQTVLRRLVFTAPLSGGTTSFAIEVDNSLQGSATDTSIAVAVAPSLVPPVIANVADQRTTDTAPIRPFASVVISDANAGQSEAVTVTLSSRLNGTLSNLGSGTYVASTGVYAVSGSASLVTASLQGLIFTPTLNQVAAGLPVYTGFTISDVDTSGASASAAGTIIATATIPTSFAIAAASARKAEGNAGATPFTFTVTRSGDTALAAGLSYYVGGTGSYQANAADFVGGAFPSGSLAFAAGETGKTITINVAGDTAYEPEETFAVTLWGQTLGSVAVPTAIGTIINDDGGPNFTIAATAAVKPEGNSGTTPFGFSINRSGDLTSTQTVFYQVAGTGTNPADAADFGGALPSGGFTFAPGDTSKPFSVAVSGDTTWEPDETFAVNIWTYSGATVSTASATGTIQNDEAGPLVGVVDASAGTAMGTHMDTSDAGGPGYLQYQYIYAGNHDLAIATSTPNVFLHTGSGNDALQVAGGNNVLDGGLGSNFLTGGTGGGADTFFTDARSAGAVWNTIRNFHQGDAATLWGFVPGISSYRWEPGLAGAAGAEGATLRANIVGGAGRSGDGIDASITFTGLSVDQAQGLQLVTGTQAAGSYLFIYNPGV